MGYTTRTSTGPPGRGDLIRFRNIVTPSRRPRSGYAGVATVGDALDTSPSNCAFLRGWYSRNKEDIGVRRVACGNWECPNCVVERIVETFAPAWSLWQGAANREVFRDEGAWHNARGRKYLLRMQGPDASPGIVALPGPDGITRVVWAPVDRVGGETYRGTQLDQVLLGDIRGMPVPETRKTKPKPDALMGSFADNPKWVEAAAEAAGFRLSLEGRRYVVAHGCTEEQFRTFLQYARERPGR